MIPPSVAPTAMPTVAPVERSPSALSPSLPLLPVLSEGADVEVNVVPVCVVEDVDSVGDSIEVVVLSSFVIVTLKYCDVAAGLVLPVS